MDLDLMVQVSEQVAEVKASSARAIEVMRMAEREITSQRATINRLKETLHELTCEAQGFLSQADPMTHGVTNMQVLMQKIEEARAVLRAKESL